MPAVTGQARLWKSFVEFSLCATERTAVGLGLACVRLRINQYRLSILRIVKILNSRSRSRSRCFAQAQDLKARFTQRPSKVSSLTVLTRSLSPS
ncbi:hypothetical protein PCANC_02165 [Puccinia coronata f. sp. avenae]|uniref:Uncharacterized protein n=1 Tax=Puccinia coronata f. sp. avenae TaxID=200324 RepID=A0A2N5W014_9BASI|nr:hypothetical protein PCASD_13880 [Puccinia coronata f. sp. avenae]PLW55557.1 hypothetical protein PCANC_02165 [Puccinia coronata f. sp. avenae]